MRNKTKEKLVMEIWEKKVGTSAFKMTPKDSFHRLMSNELEVRTKHMADRADRNFAIWREQKKFEEQRHIYERY